MVIFSRAFVRRRIISLATSLSVSATSFALAQDPGEAHHLPTSANNRSERQFLFAKDVAVSEMAQASLTPPSGDVDRDFVGMMAARNQATMELARAELLYGHNDEIRRLAQNIVAQGQHEISVMRRAVGDTSISHRRSVERGPQCPKSARRQSVIPRLASRDASRMMPCIRTNEPPGA
jgi:Domain of unknown function (DUF305)